MINRTKHLLFSLLLLSAMFGFSQETLNANDPNSFVLGGGQGNNQANLTLIPISILDIEPDPDNGISFGGIGTDLEAGMPISGGSPGGANEDLWLNFTHRTDNFQPKRIYVKSNMLIPNGLNITIQIINTVSIGGNFPANPNTNPIILTNSDQIIVYDFGSGYTGDGVGTGYQLRYTIDNTSGASLPVGFQIIYSIQ